uniref:AATF-Che1 domain-containing protein n=1 Tax=Wuchereria bancrofti TaxID=6293 RepID=A0A1I8EN29_WUCBA
MLKAKREDSKHSQSKNENVAANGVITISNGTQPESVQKQLMSWDRLMQLHILSHAALRTFIQLPRDQLAKKLLQSARVDTKKNCIIGVENSDDEEFESLIDCNEEDDSAIESDTKESERDFDIITYDNETVNRDRQKKEAKLKELTKEYEKRHERFTAFRHFKVTIYVIKMGRKSNTEYYRHNKKKKKDFSGFESVVLKIEQVKYFFYGRCTFFFNYFWKWFFPTN